MRIFNGVIGVGYGIFYVSLGIFRCVLLYGVNFGKCIDEFM